mmetsp:Transcript_93591/g.302899  ORF Transcript_93591/g.302899 Transcript_93591/m.302899 type:complete len:281 (+) Transcript_93591:143-985(+)
MLPRSSKRSASKPSAATSVARPSSSRSPPSRCRSAAMVAQMTSSLRFSAEATSTPRSTREASRATATHEAIQRGSECVTAHPAAALYVTTSSSQKYPRALAAQRMMPPLAAMLHPLSRQTTSAAMSGATSKASWSKTPQTVLPMPKPELSPNSGKPSQRHRFRAAAKALGSTTPPPETTASKSNTIWSVSSVQSPCSQRLRCLSSTLEAGLNFSGSGYFCAASDFVMNSVARPTASPNAAPQTKPRMRSARVSRSKAVCDPKTTCGDPRCWASGEVSNGG